MSLSNQPSTKARSQSERLGGARATKVAPTDHRWRGGRDGHRTRTSSAPLSVCRGIDRRKPPIGSALTTAPARVRFQHICNACRSPYVMLSQYGLPKVRFDRKPHPHAPEMEAASVRLLQVSFGKKPYPRAFEMFRTPRHRVLRCGAYLASASICALHRKGFRTTTTSCAALWFISCKCRHLRAAPQSSRTTTAPCAALWCISCRCRHLRAAPQGFRTTTAPCAALRCKLCKCRHLRAALQDARRVWAAESVLWPKAVPPRI